MMNKNWKVIHEECGCVHPLGCTHCAWCGFDAAYSEPVFGIKEDVTDEITDAHRAKYGTPVFDSLKECDC